MAAQAKPKIEAAKDSPKAEATAETAGKEDAEKQDAEDAGAEAAKTEAAKKETAKREEAKTKVNSLASRACIVCCSACYHVMLMHVASCLVYTPYTGGGGGGR